MAEEIHIQAQIIGFYRQGALITEISNVMNLELNYVKWILDKCLNQ